MLQVRGMKSIFCLFERARKRSPVGASLSLSLLEAFDLYPSWYILLVACRAERVDPPVPRRAFKVSDGILRLRHFSLLFLFLVPIEYIFFFLVHLTLLDKRHTRESVRRSVC